MRALAVAMLLLVGGCLQVDSLDGTLTCSTVPGRACPHGFYCAWDDKCYRDGDPAPLPTPSPAPPSPSEPLDLSVPVFQFDFSVPADMSMPSSDDALSSTD